jgi:hypothetical protein
MKTILFSSLLILAFSCKAQKMVQKIDDSKKLEINKDKFIGSPLKDLLKETSPKIETALGSPGSAERPSFFNFYFASKKQYDKYRTQKKFPLTIRVYVKGTFIWDKRGKSIDDWLNWTKEDTEKYGDLIITDIQVYNEENK